MRAHSPIVRSTAPFAGLVLLLPLVACAADQRVASTASEDDVTEADRYGGTAVIGGASDISDINPTTFTAYHAREVIANMLFMPLLEFDEDLESMPYLARSWEISGDTVITFHIRDDVYWHDGVKTTAHDVKFTYDLLRRPEIPILYSMLQANGYGEGEVVDSFTFRTRMRPHPEPLLMWHDFVTVPRHILDGVPPAEVSQHPFGTTRPVGNGPFRFFSRIPGQSWTFTANEEFPEELGGRPYVDRIVYRVIPEESTRLVELLTGNIDSYIVNPEQVSRIEESGSGRVVNYVIPGYTYIAWNGRRPLFSDARVRRALTMAINRREIVDGVLYGIGEVANSTVPPMLWRHDPTAGTGLEYDAEGAKRILAELGWEDRDGDGVIENREGVEFRFTMLTNTGNNARADLMDKIQSDLAKVGIAMESRLMEFNTLSARIRDTERDFDAILYGLSVGFSHVDRELFHCSEIDRGFQFAGFCDPEVDQLLNRLERPMERATAMPIWEEYQRKIASEQPYTLLYYAARSAAASNRLRNFEPDARGDFFGAREWWLAEEGIQ